jgi:hypothetical protein
MPVALFLIIAGFTILYSGLKGLSLVDVFNGATGDKLNPKGGNTRDGKTAPTTQGSQYAGEQVREVFYDPEGSWDEGKFSGPIGGHSDHIHVGASSIAMRKYLQRIAEEQFNLTITSTTGGTHVTGSLHYLGLAFDASGTAANMAAFYRYIIANHTGGTNYSKGGGAD